MKTSYVYYRVPLKERALLFRLCSPHRGGHGETHFMSLTYACTSFIAFPFWIPDLPF